MVQPCVLHPAVCLLAEYISHLTAGLLCSAASLWLFTRRTVLLRILQELALRSADGPTAIPTWASCRTTDRQKARPRRALSGQTLNSMDSAPSSHASRRHCPRLRAAAGLGSSGEPCPSSPIGIPRAISRPARCRCGSGPVLLKDGAASFAEPRAGRLSFCLRAALWPEM